MTSYIGYVRVSTTRQGVSGLGLEGQLDAIQKATANGVLVATYREVESGRRDDRPELRQALDHARRSGATLIIAKLDRLARSAAFLLKIIDSGVPVFFCDMPQVTGPSGRFLLTSMAAVAELEAGLISERTRTALAAARARGKALGCPAGENRFGNSRRVGTQRSAELNRHAANQRAELWRQTISEMVAAGSNDNVIASELNARGERSVRGGAWTAKAVCRLRGRLGIDRAA